MAPERPANTAFTGPTLLCPLGLTQFLWFQVPLFESSTCELEQPGGSQGESARRFGQNPGKRALGRLDWGQTQNTGYILCPPQHPTHFRGSHGHPWHCLPPGGSCDHLGLCLQGCQPGRRWVHGMEKRGEALSGAELSRGEGTEQSDPHTQSGSCAGPSPSFSASPHLPTV